MRPHELEDRFFDVALAEVARGDDGPQLALVVARASATVRRAAARRCEDAIARSRPNLARRRLLLAALVLVSFAAVYGIWSFDRERSDPGTPAARPFQDRVDDPNRVVPKDVDELRELLDEVESIEGRLPGVLVRIRGLPHLYLDFQEGMKGFVPIDVQHQQPILDAVRRCLGRKQVEPRKDFWPVARLLLKLRDGRNVHCLVQGGRTLRVLDGKDIELVGLNVFHKLMMQALGGSSQRTKTALGYVVQSDDGQWGPEGPRYYPYDMQVLRLCYCRDHFMHYRLAHYRQLHTLDVSNSALTFTPAAFDVSQWQPGVRGAVRDLRAFAARGAPMDDAAAADVLAAMPNLETLDLSGCTQLADRAVEAIAALPLLRELDLSGCTGIAPELFAVLEQSEALQTLWLTRASLTAAQQRQLTKAWGTRLRWRTE